MDLLERWADKREARKAYMRTYMNKYYETHSEKILESQRPYKEQRRKPTAEKRAEYNRKYYETHREDCIRRVKQYQEKQESSL